MAGRAFARSPLGAFVRSPLGARVDSRLPDQGSLLLKTSLNINLFFSRRTGSWHAPDLSWRDFLLVNTTRLLANDDGLHMYVEGNSPSEWVGLVTVTAGGYVDRLYRLNDKILLVGKGINCTQDVGSSPPRDADVALWDGADCHFVHLGLYDNPSIDIDDVCFVIDNVIMLSNPRRSANPVFTFSVDEGVTFTGVDDSSTFNYGVLRSGIKVAGFGGGYLLTFAEVDNVVFDTDPHNLMRWGGPTNANLLEVIGDDALSLPGPQPGWGDSGLLPMLPFVNSAGGVYLVGTGVQFADATVDPGDEGYVGGVALVGAGGSLDGFGGGLRREGLGSPPDAQIASVKCACWYEGRLLVGGNFDLVGWPDTIFPDGDFPDPYGFIALNTSTGAWERFRDGTAGKPVGSGTVERLIVVPWVLTSQAEEVVLGNAPMVTITSVEGGPGSNFDAGEMYNTLIFDATALDAQDGDLSSIIIWESDIDGVLGTGPHLEVDLTIGETHTITASATDTSDLTGSDAVEFDVLG